MVKKSARRTRTGKLLLANTRRRHKTIIKNACSGVVDFEVQPKMGGFSYHLLPFVKNLSKKDPTVARVLEDSYKKGGATAAVP